jgi:hypothetical protein
MNLKGYTVNPYSKGSKSKIDVVFHNGGVPSKSAEPVIKLDLRGKALRIKWKASEHLYSIKQATAQGIAKDLPHFTGYADKMDKMHKARVMPSMVTTGEPLKSSTLTGSAWTTLR